MALETQKGLLRGYTQKMYDEGTVNDQFYQMQAVKDAIRPDYVVRAITSYCTAAQNLFSQLTFFIEGDDVDFRQVDVFARDLYARTSRKFCPFNLIGTAHISRKGPVFSPWHKGFLVLTLGLFYKIRMALSIVNGLLEEYVQSLFNEGIVNNQFSHIQDVKTMEGAESAVQLINEYCTDVETILSELTSYIDLPDVDFSKMAELAGEVEKKSSRIGAEHVRLAGLNLKQACDEMHKQHFIRTLGLTKNEFTRTQNKLQVVVQMERRIIRLEAKQRS